MHKKAGCSQHSLASHLQVGHGYFIVDNVEFEDFNAQRKKETVRCTVRAIVLVGIKIGRAPQEYPFRP